METTRYHSALGDLGTRGLVEVGRNQIEKCAAALTKLIVPQYDSRGVGAFRRLREAYVALTGDSDIVGYLKPGNVSTDLRSCQDFDSGTFAYALANAKWISKSESDPVKHFSSTGIASAYSSFS